MRDRWGMSVEAMKQEFHEDQFLMNYVLWQRTRVNWLSNFTSVGDANDQKLNELNFLGWLLKKQQ